MYFAVSALMGGWLIYRGFTVIGGGAVLAGVFALGSVLRPAWLATGVVSIFWPLWTGIGLVTLLREGRWFAAFPVLFLFLLGAMRLRGLFHKPQAPRTIAAAETVIEGEVTATREEKPIPIQPE